MYHTSKALNLVAVGLVVLLLVAAGWILTTMFICRIWLILLGMVTLLSASNIVIATKFSFLGN